VREINGDGERFEVGLQPGSTYVYELKWVPGPNEGYGFTCASYGAVPLGDHEIEDAIRDFLGQVDPATATSAEAAEPPRRCTTKRPRLTVMVGGALRRSGFSRPSRRPVRHATGSAR